MMKPEEIIEGLKYTVAMCEYDPLTGDIIERCFMNDMTRTTYDACKAAIEFIEKHQYVHDKCKKCIEFSGFKKQPNSLEQIKWERDTAINQLKELGYGFGERIEKCEDCISRNDLIAAMHLIMDDAKIGYNDEDYESLDDIKEQYVEIVKGMVSVKPEIKWIPVSEKLPNSYEYVLATMISPVTQLPFVCKLYTGENAKEKIEESKVIAWTVLPKPYKEKK